MQLNDFQKAIRGKTPKKLAEEFLGNSSVAAFETPAKYDDFKISVSTFFTESELVAVAGTANWTYSLNPFKDFKSFDLSSDIDTVVVSEKHFTEAWDELRSYDRIHGYRMQQSVKDQLKRNGQNVYSGFVSPTWIPDKSNRFRYSHQKILNVLSDEKVDFKPVKMLFFRNWAEAVDYYSRGFRKAKEKI